MCIVVVYILYSMYNNNNDNDDKCDAIAYTICIYIQQDTYANLPTHRQAGWIEQERTV